MTTKAFFYAHWFIGIVFGVFLAIIGVTGALLSYEKEIIKVFNPATFKFQTHSQTQELPDLLEKVMNEQLQGRELNAITIENRLDTPLILNLASQTNRRGENIYINPYTVEILPSPSGMEMMQFIQRLHRWLAMGDIGWRDVGQHLTALATIGLIILSITGIVLYYPKIKRKFSNAYKIRFSSKGQSFLLNIHSVIGLWVAIFYIFMSLTGLFWSYDWYRGAMYKVMQVDQPVRGQAMGQGMGQRGEVKPVDLSYTQIADFYDKFQNEIKSYSSVTFRIPKSGNSFAFSYFDEPMQHSRARNQLVFDLRNGAIMSHDRYDDKALNEKIMSSMLPLHSGEFFGEIGRFLFFITSALMPLFAITGYMLYYKKKKKKS